MCFIIFLAVPEVELDLENMRTTQVPQQEQKIKKQTEPRRVSKRLQEQDQKQEDEEEKSPKKKSKLYSMSAKAEELVSGRFSHLLKLI